MSAVLPKVDTLSICEICKKKKTWRVYLSIGVRITMIRCIVCLLRIFKMFHRLMNNPVLLKKITQQGCVLLIQVIWVGHSPFEVTVQGFVLCWVFKLTTYTGWSKCLCAPDDYSTENTQKYSILNSFNHLSWTVLYWTRSSRTQFGVSINVWILVGDTLNINCNFMCCNHQVHRDFLITLYNFKMFCCRLSWLCCSKLWGRELWGYYS